MKFPTLDLSSSSSGFLKKLTKSPSCFDLQAGNSCFLQWFLQKFSQQDNIRFFRKLLLQMLLQMLLSFWCQVSAACIQERVMQDSEENYTNVIWVVRFGVFRRNFQNGILQLIYNWLIHEIKINYRTRAIITRSRFETALDYKPRILGSTFLV